MPDDNIRRITKDSSKKAGMKPGSVIHVGDIKQETNIKLIRYGQQWYDEVIVNNFEILREPSDGVNWVMVQGISSPEDIEKIGEIFNLTPFILEDITNTNSRPKLDSYEGCIFIVVKLLVFEKDKNRLSGEQISIVLGEDYILTFCEKENNIFDPVIRRIKASKSIVKDKGVDYLAYIIVDCIVDSYFEVLENIEDNMDALEEQLINKPSKDTLKGIYELKKELILLRKSIWPLREVLNDMQGGSTELIEKSTEMYLRDVYDHVIQVIDTTQLFVDISAGMLDTYLSSINNRMSEVMKILTIFSTIFIPITFLAGVFGMNFDFMPELRIWWAYPIFWMVVLSSVSFMLWTFKKKDWF